MKERKKKYIVYNEEFSPIIIFRKIVIISTIKTEKKTRVIYCLILIYEEIKIYFTLHVRILDGILFLFKFSACVCVCVQLILLDRVSRVNHTEQPYFVDEEHV